MYKNKLINIKKSPKPHVIDLNKCSNIMGCGSHEGKAGGTMGSELGRSEEDW
jgi:hypothetical protein